MAVHCVFVHQTLFPLFATMAGADRHVPQHVWVVTKSTNDVGIIENFPKLAGANLE
jgi:hypothetical protein